MRTLIAAVLLVSAVVPGIPPAGSAAAQSSERVPERSDETPLFVGPATLELSGGRGTNVWDEVRFGAHEVVLLLLAEDPEGPCEVRVRLPVGGVAEDSADDTALDVAVAPATRSIDATQHVVDYATSRLRVDSGCADWTLRLMPLPDPGLPYTIARRSYPVRGETLEELAPQTRRVRGSFAAYTTWDTDWHFALRERADACDVADGSASLAARIVLPVWRRPDDPAEGVARRWQRFLDNLEIHELGHVTIALQGADAIDERLDEGLSAATCVQATRRANRVATELHDRWERVNARYDEHTEHGLRQGTGLR